MNQVVLHLGDQYIEEDLEYYFSGERDKNNQVRPDEKIYSMTPFSEHIEMDFSDGKVGNFFYPVLPDALERIYIGISVSLFANHWGASFLLELLKHLKPGGSVVLPVYPEGQAHEKDFWSRSFLENIFLSRERWTGFSNITAENDGVMSMRVGRKWPTPMPSSAEWFFKERSNLLLASLQSDNECSDIGSRIKQKFIPLCEMMWQEYTTSAVVERIIKDYLVKKKDIQLVSVGQDYGLLANDVLLSPYINVEKAITHHIGDVDTRLDKSISAYFSAHTSNNHSAFYANQYQDVNFEQSPDVILINQLFANSGQQEYQQILSSAFKQLATNGVLIVYENLLEKPSDIQALDEMMEVIGTVKTHSAIATRTIEPSVEISQYSLAVEENLRQEKLKRENVFRVIQKA